MQRALSFALGGLAASLFSLAAFAQAADCAKARDPQRCEARQKARDACQGKRGAERRQCMEDHMPPPDCGKARYPERCEAMQAAKAACQDKAGKDRRQCLRDQLQAANPPAKK